MHSIDINVCKAKNLGTLAPDLFPKDEDVARYEELKLAINNLIWMYAPNNITLDIAENIASHIFDVIVTPDELKWLPVS